VKIILVSACLLGLKYRYDGSSNINFELLKILRGKLVKPVCPEVDGGLAIPRPPAEIIGGDGFDVLAGKASIINNKGIDVTEFYVNGANKMLTGYSDNPDNILMAILKARSPACGNKRIYSGKFDGNLKLGSGVGAALLKRKKINVYSEDNLKEIKKSL